MQLPLNDYILSEEERIPHCHSKQHYWWRASIHTLSCWFDVGFLERDSMWFLNALIIMDSSFVTALSENYLVKEMTKTLKFLWGRSCWKQWHNVSLRLLVLSSVKFLNYHELACKTSIPTEASAPFTYPAMHGIYGSNPGLFFSLFLVSPSFMFCRDNLSRPLPNPTLSWSKCHTLTGFSWRQPKSGSPSSQMTWTVLDLVVFPCCSTVPVSTDALHICTDSLHCFSCKSEQVWTCSKCRQYACLQPTWTKALHIVFNDKLMATDWPFGGWSWVPW